MADSSQDPADPSRVLPDGHELVAKLVWVPPHIRLMFSHLPERVFVEGTLPEDPAAVPVGARQLLKLALAGGEVELGDLRLGGAVRLSVVRGERRHELDALDLAGDIRVLAPRILAALFDENDFAHILEAFAVRSSILATLQRITNHMLQSHDVDRALYGMLCGITSGTGLGFNRAALFIHDEARGVFTGAKAVGPADAEEAQRIWEAIEILDAPIDAVIDGATGAGSAFQQLVQTIELRPGPDDEITTALASMGPVLCPVAPPRNAGLARLGVAHELLVAALRPHGKLLGVIVADNLFTGAAITIDQLAYSSFFIDQTALVWENQSLLEHVARLARIDGLTGVLNRREFEARFEEERSRVLRTQSTGSLMLIDIDNFKETNDRYGHPAGDDVLRRLGALLRRTLRGHDLSGRYGGDEFVVYLPSTTREHLVATAVRIGALAAEDGIALSIGGASWPGDCDDPTELLAKADESLYAAKRSGRGRACFSDATEVPFGAARNPG